MKRNIFTSAMAFLVAGLLLTALVPIIGRYYFIPDVWRGLSMGIGLALEMIGIVKLQRSKRSLSC